MRLKEAKHFRDVSINQQRTHHDMWGNHYWGNGGEAYYLTTKPDVNVWKMRTTNHVRKRDDGTTYKCDMLFKGGSRFRHESVWTTPLTESKFEIEI